MKKVSRLFIVFYILAVAIAYYVILPPMNWHAPEFWEFLVFAAGPALVILIFYSFAKRNIQLNAVSYTHLTNAQGQLITRKVSAL